MMRNGVTVKGRKRPKFEEEGSADWETIAHLLYTSDMDEEEEIRFYLGHPELDKRNRSVLKRK